VSARLGADAGSRDPPPDATLNAHARYDVLLTRGTAAIPAGQEGRPMADVTQDGDRHGLGRSPEVIRLCRPEVLAFHRKHVYKALRGRAVRRSLSLLGFFAAFIPFALGGLDDRGRREWFVSHGY
jgi:hypothetical protein